MRRAGSRWLAQVARRRCVPAVVLMLGGCGAQLPPGSAGVQCSEIQREGEWDDIIARSGNASAEDWLEQHAPDGALAADWNEDGRQVQIVTDEVPDAVAVTVVANLDAPPTITTRPPACPSEASGIATVAITSADGVLDELLEIPVDMDVDSLHGEIAVPVDSLAGTLALELADEARWPDQQLVWVLTGGDQGGSLELRARGGGGTSTFEETLLAATAE